MIKIIVNINHWQVISVTKVAFWSKQQFAERRHTMAIGRQTWYSELVTRHEDIPFQILGLGPDRSSRLHKKDHQNLQVWANALHQENMKMLGYAYLA